MEKEKDKTASAILHLADQVGKLRGTDGHMTLQDMKGKKGLIGVISVYVNQKPAQMVLEELFEWAEETGNVQLVDKIIELEEDMSWNEDQELDEME